MPKVSIVLPSYNGARFLAQSVNSVIEQSLRDWELIVVNDCSTDNTAEIAEQFAKKDARIRLINNPCNRKLPASLNIGFSQAQGKYLTWTSDDNLFKPDALAKLAQHLDEHPQTAMAVMNMDIVDEDGLKLREFEDEYRFRRCAASLMHNCNVGAAFMYRREIADKIGGYNEERFCAEDYDYWCRIALAGNIDYLKDNIYAYRLNGMSLSAKRKQEVAWQTLQVKLQYAEAFFAKFGYTEEDKAKFWFHTLKVRRPAAYRRYYPRLRLQRLLAQVISAAVFWSKPQRQSIRRIITGGDNYSFSQIKG